MCSDQNSAFWGRSRTSDYRWTELRWKVDFVNGHTVGYPWHFKSNEDIITKFKWHKFQIIRVYRKKDWWEWHYSFLLSYPHTVPNMALQVTSKFIGFSVKIANFWKNSFNVLTSFLMPNWLFLPPNSASKKHKKLVKSLLLFFSLFPPSYKFEIIHFLMELVICREFWGQIRNLCIKIK